MALQQILKCWDHKLKPNERHIMMAYADHANEDGTGAWPSNERIAWKTGYSVRNVQKIRKQLVKKGILVKVKSASRYKPTEYRIEWSAAQEKEPFAPSVNKNESGEKQGRKDDTPPQNGREQSDATDANARYSRHEQSDVSEVNATAPEPSVEPSYNRQGEPSARARARDDSESSPSDEMTDVNEGGEDNDREPSDIYREVFPRRPNNIQTDMMNQSVEDLARWEKVLKWWASNGHRAKSVRKMIQKYEEVGRGDYRDDFFDDVAPGSDSERSYDPDDGWEETFGHLDKPLSRQIGIRSNFDEYNGPMDKETHAEVVRDVNEGNTMGMEPEVYAFLKELRALAEEETPDDATQAEVDEHMWARYSNMGKTHHPTVVTPPWPDRLDDNLKQADQHDERKQPA